MKLARTFVVIFVSSAALVSGITLADDGLGSVHEEALVEARRPAPVVQAAVGYVVAGILPPQGAVCVQQGEPFPAADED